MKIYKPKSHAKHLIKLQFHTNRENVEKLLQMKTEKLTV